MGQGGAGAGGGVSSQEALHVLQLRPCTAELTSDPGPVCCV